MNSTNPNPQPPLIPPQLPPVHPRPPVPLGENPEERVPITGPFGAVEAILRQPRRLMYQLRQPNPGGLVAGMLLGAVFCALVYGAVMGSFSMGPQIWAVPVKVSAGLMISGLICLPSLYIFACLSGSNARLIEVFGMVSGLLLLMTLLLVGFAPVAWLFSQSTESQPWMGTLHLLFALIAVIFGLRFVHAAFAHSHARSTAGLYTWTFIFVLVALQMTTALRPLVGKYDPKHFLPEKKQFFLSHWGECLDEPTKKWPANATSENGNSQSSKTD